MNELMNCLNKIELSIIIVSYNTSSITFNCIESIYKQNLYIPFEIILIDNASNDHTVELIKQKFPEVITIENTENKMFSIANNQGIHISKGEFILLLNSDTLFVDTSVEFMVQFMCKTANCCCAGPRVINEDNSFQSEGFPFGSIYYSIVYSLFNLNKFPIPDNIKRKLLPLGTKNIDRGLVRKVGWISGCFMLIKKNCIELVGGLNEQLFFFGEEIEWCYRAHKKGYDIFVIPTATIIHLGGKSTKGEIAKLINDRNKRIEGYLNLQRLTIGYFSTFIMSAMMAIKHFLIMLFFLFVSNNRNVIKQYEAVKDEILILRKIL